MRSIRPAALRPAVLRPAVRSAARSAALCAALCAALALAALPADAQDRLTLMLDWFVNPNHGPILLADDLGLFEAAGLDVEIVAPADPTAPPKMVAAGAADLAVSYQPQQHLQVAEGLPLLRVGTLMPMPTNCVLVRADSDIAGIADLAGRRVGFSVAGVEEALLQRLLAEVGLTLDDIEMVNVNFSLAPALMAGQVDAVIGAVRNFTPVQMALEGVPGRCFNLEEEGLPPYDELIYVANAEAVADPAHADRLARFLAATEKATHRIVNDPGAAWETISATRPELQDALNAGAWDQTWARFALAPAALDAGRYARFEAFMAEAGLIEGTRPVARIAVDLGAE